MLPGFLEIFWEKFYIAMYIVDPLLASNVDNTDNREYNEIERLYGLE